MGVRVVRQNWARNSVLARFGSKILYRRELSLGGFWGREGGREPGLGARPDWRANGRAGSGHRSIGGGRDWALDPSRVGSRRVETCRRGSRCHGGCGDQAAASASGRSSALELGAVGAVEADDRHAWTCDCGPPQRARRGWSRGARGGRTQTGRGAGRGGRGCTPEHGTQGAGHAGRLALDSGVRASWRADQPSGRAPRTGIPGGRGGVGCVWRRPCL